LGDRERRPHCLHGFTPFLLNSFDNARFSISLMLFLKPPPVTAVDPIPVSSTRYNAYRRSPVETAPFQA
jgi:hypothetical protein